MQNITPQFVLRIGLGSMFLYSGFDLVRNPEVWLWAFGSLPMFLQSFIDGFIGTELYLRLQGMFELVLAALMFGWFLPAWVVRFGALAITFEMAGILLLVGVDAITFRDFGLVAAGLALFLLLRKSDFRTSGAYENN